MPRKEIALSLVMLFGVWGCGSSEPEAPEEPQIGTVNQMDPALESIVPADYKIEKLQGGFQFTEGPVWIPGESPHLLFSDIPANTIFKWSAAAGVEEFLKPVYEGERTEGSLGSNGLLLDPQGRLVLCEHGARRVSRMVDGELQTIVDEYQDKRLNSPNDAVYASGGALYFTDPPYGLPEQDEDPAKELDFNGVFRLSPDEEDLQLLTKEQTRPNGIGFSPDGKTLYVANSDQENRVWMAYPVNDDGSIGEGGVFFDANALEAEGVPDGLAIDSKGYVYATGPGGVLILSPAGKHLGTIELPELPANCTFGGPQGNELYITARTGLYRIGLNAKGLSL